MAKMTDNNTEKKVVETLQIRVTTREDLWAKIYQAAIDRGFEPLKACAESDKIVEQVFGMMQEGEEEELRAASRYTEVEN